MEKTTQKITTNRVFIYWSYVPELWSKMIVYITGGQTPDYSDRWSHMGIAFELSNGTVEAYEALFSYGFNGPEPMENINKKVHDKKGKLELIDANIKNIYLESIYDLCKSWVGKRGYNKFQLILMWYYERFGRWFGWKIPTSPGKLVCSEAVARLVYPHIDLRDVIRKNFDEINPNSAWRKWWLIRQQRI